MDPHHAAGASTRRTGPLASEAIRHAHAGATFPALFLLVLIASQGFSPKVSGSTRLLCSPTESHSCKEARKEASARPELGQYNPYSSTYASSSEGARNATLAEKRDLLSLVNADACSNLHRSMQSGGVLTDMDGYDFFPVSVDELRACRRKALSASSLVPGSGTLMANGAMRLDTALDQAKKDLVNTIRYLRHFYGFQNIAKNSPNPNLPLKYNVAQALGALQKKSYDSADDLYDAMVVAVRGLNDAHTVVSKNVETTFNLALRLVFVRVAPQTFEVQVAPAQLHPKKLIATALEKFGFKASLYYGATVLKIEGQNAYPYMREFADKMGGKYPSLGARFNAAFDRQKWVARTDEKPEAEIVPGTFSQRSVNPRVTKIKMTVRLKGSSNPQSISVPWTGLVPSKNAQAFQNSASFSSAFWTGARERRHTERKAKKQWEHLGEAPQPEPGTEPRFAPAAAAKAMSAATKISGMDDYYPVYLLSDKITGVVVIPRFKIDSTQEEDIAQFFMVEITKAFKTAIKKRATRVILDLQGNGGGITVWASLLQQILMGEAAYTQGSGLKYRNSDFSRFRADTPLVLAMVNNVAPYDWSAYTDVYEVRYKESTKSTFFLPTQALNFTTGKYSKWFKLSVKKIEDALPTLTGPALGNVPFLLLSDGQCYSTCSTFAAGMKVRFKQKLVTVGGLPGQKLQFHAGGGGFIVKDGADGIYEKLQEAADSEDLDLSKFPGAPEQLEGISLTMKQTVGFVSPQSPYPVEFTYHPGDARIMYTPDNILDFST